MEKRQREGETKMRHIDRTGKIKERGRGRRREREVGKYEARDLTKIHTARP